MPGIFRIRVGLVGKGYPFATIEIEGATISLQVLGRSTVMHKEGPGVVGWEAGSCQSGGTTREDLHEMHVRAAGRDSVSPPSHPPQQGISLRSPMVGYISRGVEWHHNDARWELEPSITSGVDGCIRAFWLRSMVASC